MTQVLVVDDSLSVRKALETILRPLAYTVRMADSGEAALLALRDAPVDLVIADVLMPGLSGFELCRQVKADAAHRDVPVVLISGIVGDEERRHAHEVGALEVVKKPFRSDDLLPVVRGAVENAAKAARAAVPAAPVQSPAAPPQFTALLDTLLGKQGILGAALIGPGGEALASCGETLPDEPAVAQYLRFFVSASQVLGLRLQEGWQSVLTEYDRRSLLLVAVGGSYTLAVVLRDAGSANVAKYVIRSQRPQFEEALSPN